MSIKEIKEYMKKNKITYETLSKTAGIPLTTIKYIFSGKTPNPRIDTMNAILTALELNDSAWTSDEIANGISSTIRVNVTPDEDDLLYLYRRIQRELGEAGAKTYKEIGELLLQIKKPPKLV